MSSSRVRAKVFRRPDGALVRRDADGRFTVLDRAHGVHDNNHHLAPDGPQDLFAGPRRSRHQPSRRDRPPESAD